MIIFFVSNASAVVVDRLEIIGNTKTKYAVIADEIEFSPGMNIDEPWITEAQQRLQNIRLFTDVKVKRVKNVVNVKITERWTTIPIMKFNSGGGVQQLTLGVYDPHIAGRNLELGTQYQKLEDTHSGVIWFKKPRFLSRSYGIDLQYWKTNRLRTKYDQTEDRLVVKNGFLHIRDKLYTAIIKEHSQLLKTRYFYEFNRDKFSNRIIPAEVKAQSIAVGLPPDSNFHFAGIGTTYGRINYQEWLQSGQDFSLYARYAFASTDNIDNFFDVNGTYRFFHAYKDHNFAQRIQFGITNTDVLQYWNYLGGLDKIRGYTDNRFAGRYYILSNSEYRVPLYQRPSFVFQSVGFLDLVSVADKVRDISSLRGSSIGLDGRIILPRIYRFVLRLDYARLLKRKDDNSISFGVQQFF